MPNIPTQFITLAHDAFASTPFNLKVAMRSALRGNMDDCMGFLDSVATALQAPLLAWKGAQQVMLVLAQGPIPSFAPPYVPVDRWPGAQFCLGRTSTPSQ